MQYKEGDIFILKHSLYDGPTYFKKGIRGKIIRKPTEHGLYHIEWEIQFDYGHNDGGKGKDGHCWNFDCYQIDRNSSLYTTPQLELDL